MRFFVYVSGQKQAGGQNCPQKAYEFEPYGIPDNAQSPHE